MVDIIKNKNMLTNIRPPNNPVEITGIGGTKIRVNHIGDLLVYGSVYFHPDISANNSFLSSFGKEIQVCFI